MSAFGRHKLSDAVPRPPGSKSSSRRGKPATDPTLAAEQTREAHERDAAHNAEASIRDRMVDIGRGNQQAGRQNGD